MVFYTNTCDEKLDVFIAIERKNGTWSTGIYSELKSGKKADFFVCNVTQNIVLLTRKFGTNSKFPSSTELKDRYSTSKQ